MCDDDITGVIKVGCVYITMRAWCGGGGVRREEPVISFDNITPLQEIMYSRGLY